MSRTVALKLSWESVLEILVIRVVSVISFILAIDLVERVVALNPDQCMC